MLSVFLVEDDPLLCRSLSRALAETNVSLTKICNNAAEAFAALARGLQFDAALIDLGLPEVSGLEVVREAARARRQAAVLAFTQFEDAERVMSALRFGACGYLLKDTPVARLPALLEEAVRGGSPLSPTVAKLVIAEARTRQGPLALSAPLSEREHGVLICLARGDSFADTAKKLGVERSQVQVFVKSIYRKLQINSKLEARDWAKAHGVQSLDDS